MKFKNLYKGQFNWQREIYTFYRYAFSEDSAKVLMFRALAKKLDTSIQNIKVYFNGSSDNFKIRKEK